MYLFFNTVRKWKKTSTLGNEGKWEYEIGEDLRPVSLGSEHICESRSNVSFIWLCNLTAGVVDVVWYGVV